MATAAVAKTVQKHHTCPALASTQTPKTTPTHPTPQSCICLPPPPHPVNPTLYQSSVYPRLVTMHESDVTCCSVGVVLLSPASPPPPQSKSPPHPPGHNLSAPNCFYSLMHESDVTGCRVGAALLRGQYQEAVRLIMQPRDGEREESAEARRLYLEKGASACMWVQWCTSLLCSRWPGFACILAL